MLDKISEQILKSVLAHIHGEQQFAFKYEIYSYIDKNTPKKLIDLSISNLKKQGYIKISYLDYVGNENGKTILIPTYDGYCYFETKRKSFFRRAITPITVSVIANIVINALQWLLPTLLQWLSNFL